MSKFNYLNIETIYENGISIKDAIPLGKIKKGQKISIMSNSMKNNMLNNPKNIKYSCGLIEDFVDVPYEELLENMHLSSEVVPKNFEREKNQSCDLVAVLGDRIYNIEINNNIGIYVMERNLHYGFRLYAKKVAKGSEEDDPYTNVLQLNLNNFAPIGETKTIDIFYIQNQDGKALTDKLIFVQIYVPNIRRKCYNTGIDSLSKLERRILAMAEEDVELSKELGKGDELMEEFIDDAIFASGEDDLREAYDKEWALRDQGQREGYEVGKQRGFEEGRQTGYEKGHQTGYEQGHQTGYEQGHQTGYEQGLEQEKIEVAKNLLQQHVEDAIILSATGLSIEELQKLKEEI